MHMHFLLKHYRSQKSSFIVSALVILIKNVSETGIPINILMLSDN